MSSEKLKTQVLFENILSSNNPVVWNSLTKGQIRIFSFTASHNVLFESALLYDSLDFYYKGVISLNEGIVSSKNKNFSWATVKLYYSTYYFLRASLCCKKIAFVRKERDGYSFKNMASESPIPNGKPDHIAAVELFKQNFSTTDFLQSNTINGQNTYDWLRCQRENVNYRHRTFYEPDVPDIWDAISQEFDNEGMEFWINKYLTEDIYAFLDDHAVIALPIRRLILTHSDLLGAGYRTIISPDKTAKLENYCDEYDFLKLLKPYYRT